MRQEWFEQKVTKTVKQLTEKTEAERKPRDRPL